MQNDVERNKTNELFTRMSRNPVTLDGHASLDDAQRVLEEYRFRHLPVVEQNRLVGILSDRDLRLATSLLPVAKRLRARDGQHVEGPKLVREIMKTDVHCLTPEATTALKRRAPSTWSGRPSSRVSERRARRFSSGTTVPPAPMWVCSTHTSPVRGECT